MYCHMHIFKTINKKKEGDKQQMDKNFHYYAVKVIATLAGFRPDEAQIIAQFSQFVDDFILSQAIPINQSDVPPFAAGIKDLYDGKSFHTVKTGITIFRSMSSDEQEKVVIPFHFIPVRQLLEKKQTYTTVPANFKDNSLIDFMLNGVISQAVWLGNPWSMTLLGIVLHIFADTWAHQGFSGYKEDLNKGYIDEANTHIGTVSTRKNFYGYELLSPIGHANFGHAPDESALSYTCHQMDSSKSYRPKPLRYNSDVFINCAKQMLCALMFAKTQGRESPNTADYNRLETILKKGFAIDEHDNDDILAEHWKQSCSDIGFHYNSNEIIKDIFGLNERKLPKDISAEQAYDLLRGCGSDHNEKEQGSNNIERLSALGAIKPTNTFYFYNRCAYDIREYIFYKPRKER